ncbi:MAG: hypothetical protein LUB59_04345 [Candidatus Gastranaerophilales bacterium]|nr:hypothetical protein [Candidatus Gastranaerophilales bacterium]
MAKKLHVEFDPNVEQQDLIVDNALLTQLMVQVAQIGIRVDNTESTINNNKGEQKWQRQTALEKRL